MKKQRLEELIVVAENEIHYRGQTKGWGLIQITYSNTYNLTEREAKIVAHLVQNATVVLPDVPLSMLLED